uniref:Hyaluronan/mRNA-binding protein domain-containing protein n=1 Tax=Tetraselmis sp. GSL018 TaxID=582737 RepID=A0A061RNE6_9CHLO|eukprot:CAMPEP_0177578432 /NCGR_PEP_ID=MMETSP0419_2-20121207/346_1 /TAXON_ID=582737 /ORGANISM="Tetraselmis sp., Strain GSL018" /LENGTH=70 /DNA_ID=CAMNT_0019066877 /DNA_START=162 /DNA_END=374 /DNA_ORIENTATION=+
MDNAHDKSEAEFKAQKHREDYQRLLKAKNERLDRHSATGVDGQPKKGGRGGKGVWGSPEDDIQDCLKTSS